MNITILRIQLSHLWNSEYCIFVNQIVTIFQKFEIEALHLKKSFDRVLALLPEIAKIKAKEPVFEGLWGYEQSIKGFEYRTQNADCNNCRSGEQVRQAEYAFVVATGIGNEAFS